MQYDNSCTETEMSCAGDDRDLKQHATDLVHELLQNEECSDHKYDQTHLRWLERELLRLLKDKCQLQADRAKFIAERNEFHRKHKKR